MKECQQKPLFQSSKPESDIYKQFSILTHRAQSFFRGPQTHKLIHIVHHFVVGKLHPQSGPQKSLQYQPQHQVHAARTLSLVRPHQPDSQLGRARYRVQEGEFSLSKEYFGLKMNSLKEKTSSFKQNFQQDKQGREPGAPNKKM